MGKPKIFISSTFYDLKQIRSDIDSFIQNLGYDSVRNEDGNIPYGTEEALEKYCYKEIKSINIFVSIIGGVFGTESQDRKFSISQLELKTAHKEGKQIYIFIDNNVLSEFETYILNKDKDVSYRYVDDIRIYKFVEEVKRLDSNNNIKGFNIASDITRYLKEQFAGLFQGFLEEKTRQKEVSLINNLEKTAQTLNNLVSYLSDENKDQADEINRILSINHPLVEELRSMLKIEFNFYIEGYEDMNSLLTQQGWQNNTITFFDEIADVNYYIWDNSDDIYKNYQLRIARSIFDINNKLKFIKRIDWIKDYIILYTFSKSTDANDLPF